MSTLYLRLPSRAAAGSTPHWPTLSCPFALTSHSSVSHDPTIERQGVLPLPDLSDTIAKVQRVLVLLSASDVTLLRVKVPTLSSARLKAALPNLVEDQLVADPSDCVVVAGGVADGLRTVAVVQRAWLNTLVKALLSFGAHKITVLPAQLCLPYRPAQSGQPGSVTVAIYKHRNAIDLTFHISEHDGFGATVSADQDESAVQEVIQTVCAIVPEASIELYVPQSETHAFQEAVNNTGALNKRINIMDDNWSYWISGTRGTTLDLMAGLGTGTASKLELRAWRWPMALAAAVLVVNITALNIDWWHLKGEASVLRATMIQIYKSTFPKETVIIDPVAQMKQKIALAKRDAGLASLDDFAAITTAYGEALTNITSATGKLPSIAALEYHERTLIVRFKPFSGSVGTHDVDQRDNEAITQKMKAALAERSLSLEQVPSESAIVWKIRSAK